MEFDRISYKKKRKNQTLKGIPNFSNEKEGACEQAVRYNYSIVVSSDIGSEAVVKEMVDVCQIACEKHAAAEKSPAERNNMAAANVIKVRQGLAWKA